MFNLADSAIVVGLVGLMITMLTTNSLPERYSASEAFLFPGCAGADGGLFERRCRHDAGDRRHRNGSKGRTVEEVRRVVVDVRDERLDKFLASRETDLSRAHIAGLVAGGLVKVDGAIVKSSYRLRGGETGGDGDASASRPQACLLRKYRSR